MERAPSQIFDREDFVGAPGKAEQHPEADEEDDQGKREAQQIGFGPEREKCAVLRSDEIITTLSEGCTANSHSSVVGPLAPGMLQSRKTASNGALWY